MKPRRATGLSVGVSISLMILGLIACVPSWGPVQVTSPATGATPLPATPTFGPTATATPISTPAQASSMPRLSPTPLTAKPTTMPASASYHYGLVYAYSSNDWTEADRPAIRKHFGYLREMGVNTIVQIFSSRLIGSGREQDWLILLDEAEQANIQVIARLWPSNDWNGSEFNFQTIQSFLAVVQNHPALLAYLGLHEPLEQFNSDQLQSFYTGVKRLAPQLAIANYMGNMAWFDKNLRFPNRAFGAGICDICIIYYYPAREVNGQPVLDQDMLREVLRTNRKLVDERAPRAQLWFLGQAYTLRGYRPPLRMPTPEEMETIYLTAMQERVDGFLWYPWVQANYDQVLSDPEMEPQRQAVRRIFENHILATRTP